MIEIDGAYMEGGGQIIRTAIGLSALLKESIIIENIRAKRLKPGLSFQHVSAINAVAQLCSAQTKGVFIGSDKIEFYPKKNWTAKDIQINIPTAGSVGLAIQPLIIAATRCKRKINIKIEGGGSFGKWAPPTTYIQNVLSEALREFGYEMKVDILRHGFYPKGNSLTEIQIMPVKPRSAKLNLFCNKVCVFGSSIASKNLGGKNVASRQTKTTKEILQKANIFGNISIETKYVDSISTGSGLVLWTGNKIFIGASSIGERGKTAECVGEAAALELIEEYEKGACVDKYLCDQLIPFLAICGGNIKTSELTRHTQTNIWLVKKFMDVDFDIDKANNI
ncbi:MAG: RNA 3'-terminal phosphate cyclase, partial [Candidatus Aenigmarchaeota archaeon]|nr:RNA 3'-terminal phosphate cyclase [Candidatus Aenigmarchaeota archaeon]